jgi:epsilon-lactone hydrolase
MRAWVEDVAGPLPVAENVQIERVNCAPCDGDLILPAGGDASRLISFYHGGGLFGFQPHASRHRFKLGARSG